MRFGLIGTGYWAAEVHARGVEATDGAELVGVWGRDAGKASAVAERFGATSHDDPAALFADVDAVTFAVPPSVQAPLAVQAARAGCHLLLEKPTALTTDEADAIADAVEASGVASTVFFTARHTAPVQEWLVGLQAQGGWTGASAFWMGSIFHEGNPFGSSPWRRQEGGLWDVGPHALSMLLPALGPVAEVTAVPGPGDTVHLVLRHDSGASSSATVSLTVPEQAAVLRFDVYGDAGWTSIPSDHGVLPEQAHAAAVQALLVAAAGGPAHPCDARFGAEVTRVLAQAAAQLHGGPVPVVD